MALLDNKVALVTGANRGVGAAVVRLFRDEGAQVALHYRSDEAQAQALAAEIGAMAFRAELTDPASVQSMVDAVVKKFGKIDILVNTAASYTHGTLFIDDDWASYLTELNGVLGATFHVTRAVAPLMKAAGYGRIINFGATLLQRPVSDCAPHITAKAAVLGFTRALSRELGPFGITVNIVHPGMTLTDHTKGLPLAQRDAVSKRTPMGRLAEADDVAKAVLLFASDYAGFITGGELAPDGGLTVI